MSKTVAGGTTTTYTPNAANELASFSDTTGRNVSFGYDANGNRTSRVEGSATNTYSYDLENRLTGVSEAGTTYAYVYDYRTRRVERTEGSVSTQVVFSGGTSVQEYTGDGTGGPSAEFIRGSDWGGGVGGILYSEKAGGASFDHYDGRGDVATQTNSSGSITYQAEYEAWGTRTQEFGSDGDRQRANTKEEDPTGLLDEGMRYRDLETGSFITRDPAGFLDGPNLYAYVNRGQSTYFDKKALEAQFRAHGAQCPFGVWRGVLSRHGPGQSSAADLLRGRGSPVLGGRSSRGLRTHGLAGARLGAAG